MGFKQCDTIPYTINTRFWFVSCKRFYWPISKQPT